MLKTNGRESTLMRIMMMRINNLILSIIPFIVSYALVSSIGQPQHHYSSPNLAVLRD